jgi:hypothetical protein
MLPALVVAALFQLGAVEPPAPPPAPESTISPQPSAAPKELLKEIGHVKAVTPFCKAFVTHFNNSAQLMTSNDEQISYIDFTFGNIDKRFTELGGELRFYEDRVRLMAWVKTVQQHIPVLQDEINQLRRSAALTIDPGTAKAAREVATQLQTSLDKQKQIANDALGVIHAMIDVTDGKTKPDLGSRWDHEVYDATTPQAMRDVRSYLKMDKQLGRIGDAESAAMNGAGLVALGCGE